MGDSTDHDIAGWREVPVTAAGARLDVVAARLYPRFSRARLQQWIETGALVVDGASRRTRDRLAGGERLHLSPPALNAVSREGESVDVASLEPECTGLRVVHADPHVFVLDKPAGLVMHPAPGHPRGTAMHGLLYLDPSLRGVPRAGIVHRLDRDTTGLFVAARRLDAHAALVARLQAREVGREYVALVAGHPPSSGTIEAPIARHPVDRKRMAIVAGGRAATTHYEVERRFDDATRLRLRLETGRTHQIRVHMQHIGFPLLGDPVYGRSKGYRGPVAVRAAVAALGRQALHARRLAFAHPEDDRPVSFESPVPEDMQRVLDALDGSQETR